MNERMHYGLTQRAAGYESATQALVATLDTGTVPADAPKPMREALERVLGRKPTQGGDMRYPTQFASGEASGLAAYDELMQTAREKQKREAEERMQAEITRVLAVPALPETSRRAIALLCADALELVRNECWFKEKLLDHLPAGALRGLVACKERIVDRPELVEQLLAEYPTAMELAFATGQMLALHDVLECGGHRTADVALAFLGESLPAEERSHVDDDADDEGTEGDDDGE